MGKPLIGITAAHHSEEIVTFPRAYYVESVKRAGGIPLILPLLASPEEALEVTEVIDGLILSGGGDISPRYLEEPPLRGIGNCIPARDVSELLLAKAALQQNLPVLGICRGIQVLAVAAGGRIHQDLLCQWPDSFQHSQKAPRESAWHDVEIPPETLLYNLLKEGKIGVNSFHHQAVSEIPPGFRQNAASPDGVIEGIENPALKFCLGVQWHPESMLDTEKHSLLLFKGFVEACVKS